MSLFVRLLLAATLAFSAFASVHADEKGDFILRLRAVILDPEEEGEFSVVGGSPKLDNPYGFELNANYFATDNLALELVFIGGAQLRPQALGTALGDVNLGSVLVSPAALTAQYHFLNSGDRIRPYVGAGVNYTIFSDVDAGDAISDIRYDDTFGFHFQAGTNIRLTDRWSFNLDVKRLFNDTRAEVNGGTIIGNADLDPWIYGVGVAYRF